MSKLAIIAAFVGTIAGTATVTGLFLDTRYADAQQKAAEKDATPAVAASTGPWQISAYIAGDARSKTLTNGFVVINTSTGKTSNCVANWMGQKDAKCYDWSTWVTLP